MDVPCCKDWETGMNKINDFIVFGWTHRMLYDGKKFVYCPWCGKKLVDKDKEKIKGGL